MDLKTKVIKFQILIKCGKHLINVILLVQQVSTLIIIIARIKVIILFEHPIMDKIQERAR